MVSIAELASKYRSRKFIIAIASFAAATVMAFYGCWAKAVSASDIAIILGSWGAFDAIILKLYNDANLAAEEEAVDQAVGK